MYHKHVKIIVNTIIQISLVKLYRFLIVLSQIKKLGILLRSLITMTLNYT